MSEIRVPSGASVRLTPALPELGISLFCMRCRQVFDAGPAGISVEVNGQVYLLMTEFTPDCCGIKRLVVKTFPSSADAFQEIRSLIEQIRETGLQSPPWMALESIKSPKCRGQWDGVQHSS